MTSALFEALQASLKGGASSRGLSYYKTAMKCTRAAALQVKYADIERPIGGGFTQGIYLHKLCEFYHIGNKIIDEIPPQPTVEDEHLSEAFRVFEAYRKKCAADEWGEVVAVEEEVSGPDVTGRLDMVVRVSEEKSQQLLDKWSLFVLPGLYVVDYKFLSAKQKHWLADHEYGMQFKLYPMLWNGSHDEKVLGSIVLRVLKYKETRGNPEGPSIEPLFVKLPTADEQKAVWDYIDLAKNRLTLEPNVPNLGNCFSESICPWFTNGLCDRRRSE